MKDEIREKLKIKRRYFYGVRREVADANIRDNFFAAFGSFDSFFIYNSFGTEADTKEIIKELLSLGKKVYLPRVDGGIIVPVPYGEMKKGAFGIEEPTGQAYSGDIEITVAPLLAVSERGDRIGYGKGYYDKYFKTAKTKRVGLGYYFQFEDFCGDGRDEPLDMFLCERGIFGFGK